MTVKSLDINHASTCELEQLLHDREQAQLIVNKREIVGDFQSWEEVQKTVPGLTDEMVHALRTKGVTVGRVPLARTPRSRVVRRRHMGSRAHAHG
jgi:DNA uptake protein ComE-like DNA-binding protein